MKTTKHTIRRFDYFLSPYNCYKIVLISTSINRYSTENKLFKTKKVIKSHLK